MQNHNTKHFRWWLRALVRPGGMRITETIAHRYGSQIGFVYVGGYPKSGTSWISQLVAHYLDLPFIKPFPTLPITFKCLVHHHWTYHPTLDYSIYVVRDGRDVMTSLYFTVMMGYLRSKKTVSELSMISVKPLVANFGKFYEVNRRLHYLFGKDFDPWDTERYLPTFIEAEMKKPFRWAVKQSWPTYVGSWREKGQQTTFVKYEDMLQDPVDTLSKALAHHLETEIDREQVKYTVQRYSFKKQTGRKQGTEDRSSFFRKGIHGDWANHFTTEAAKVFDHYAGELLIELGYEQDRQWIENCRQDEN